MKAIFSSLNLDDGAPSEASTHTKGKGLAQEVAVAGGQEGLWGDEQA
jgi:hypothetical protein